MYSHLTLRELRRLARAEPDNAALLRALVAKLEERLRRHEDHLD